MIDKLETYLKNSEKRQKYMIYATFLLCLFFIGKEMIPSLLKEQENLKSNVNEIQRKISKKSINRLKKQIAVKNKELLKKQNELDKQKEDIAYVMSNIYKIKQTNFSEQKWANILDKLLKDSVKKDLEIISLKANQVVDESKSVVKMKKNLQIEGLGSYKNIVNYLNYIGNLESLIKIKKTEMILQEDRVKFLVELDTYGVGL